MSALALLFVLAASPTLTPITPPEWGQGAMAPGLCRTANDLCLTWIDHPGETWRLRFARLQKGAWTAPVTIAESAKLVANWADTPSVARGGDGVLIAHWAERNGEAHHAYDAVVARSTDDGKTWRRLGPANDDGTPTEHGFVSMVPEPKSLSLAWLDGRQTLDGGATALRLGTFAKDAVVSQVVDGRVCDCCGTSAAVTADGPVLVYRDRSGEEVRDISIVRRVGGTWSEPRAVHADGWSIPGCPVNGPQVAARGRAVVVAWYTYAKSEPHVRVAFSSDSGATFGEAIEIDAARGASMPIGRVGVALDDDGTALVSWVAAKREDAEVFVRRAAADGRVGDTVSAGASAAMRQSGFPRIARDGKDLVVVWSDGQAPRLARAPMSAFPKVSATSAAAGEATARSSVKQAPSTEVATLEGKKVSLQQLAGKAVLVNFWATWCEPCRMELPELSALEARHREKGLVVVGVSVDRTATASDVKTFADRRKVVFPLWHDPDERLASAFGVQTLPASFLLDRKGNVVWSQTGAVAPNDAALAAAIDKAIAK